MTSAALPRLRSALFYALRAVFRALPVSEATQDRLRQRFFDGFPTIRPARPRGLTAAGSTVRRPYMHSGGRALGYVEHSIEPVPDPLPATLVAFYLPQFHTIPQNDEWWGKGFTEWRNVARALPQFEGHAQPRLPGDLGFYDLRNPQAMRDQAKLAREYGISAFCFYFYWFGGKTLLEEPLRQWLNDPSIDLSFCLCWANENWSRRWDGRAEDVLIAQSHSAEDDLGFIAHIAPYLRDSRYLRVDGKPLLLVYRAPLLPDAVATATRWRRWCSENGIGEIFIACVQSFNVSNPLQLGFDAAVEFPPNLSTPENLTTRQRLLNPAFAGDVVDWRELASDYERRPLPSYPLFPGVNCGWDNEPRRPGRGRVYAHASPYRYRQWLRRTIADRMAGVAPARQLVFLNAWNEWAEGAVLEPDARLGHAWLQATRGALHDAAHPRVYPHARPAVVVHAWYTNTFADILAALERSGFAHRLVVTTTEDRAEAVRAVLRERGTHAEVIVGENRGRDVLPFLRVATRLRAEGEDLVLKLHTKHSPHTAEGNRWRQALVNGLLSDAAGVRERFEGDPRLGLVAVAEYYPLLVEATGANEVNLQALAARLGIRAPNMVADRFPSGTMFWVRLAALAPLLDAHLTESDFETESGQIDGTLAHSVERLVGVCVEAAGFRSTTAGSGH